MENTIQNAMQNTNTIEDIYILLTPTAKRDCKWELEGNGSKIKCIMKDGEFFSRYLSNIEKLGGNEKLRIRMKIDSFLEGNKVRKKYTILKITEKIQERNLFNWQEVDK